MYVFHAILLGEGAIKSANDGGIKVAINEWLFFGVGGELVNLTSYFVPN